MLHDARPRHEEQLGAVDAQIVNVEENVQRYLAAFESKTMPKADCGNRVGILSERLRQLRMRRAELVASAEDDPQAADVDLDALIPEVDTLLSADAEVPALKAALRILIQEVRVEGRDAIYPTFRVPLHTPVRELSGVVPRIGFEPMISALRGGFGAFWGGCAVPPRAVLYSKPGRAAVRRAAR